MQQISTHSKKRNQFISFCLSSSMMHRLLLLGLLMVAFVTDSQAENGFSQYWEEHVGLPQPPHWLVSKAYPLNLPQVRVYMKLIEENKLASHLPLFCKQANVYCSTNALEKRTIGDTTLLPRPQWNNNKLKYDLPNKIPISVASQGGLPYFRKSMVKEGGFMPVPDLRDSISYKSFLPRSLASKIPFTFAQINELKKLFGVLDESNMDEHIQSTLETCEKSPIRGEQCTCTTSAEDLIDFVVKKLGHLVHVWSTENVEGSYENVTIGNVKLIYGNLSEPSALCHSLPFLFQHSQAENAFSRYWKEHIDLPQPPDWLAAKTSPLNLHLAAVFMKLMEKNELVFHLRLFCKQANIACSTNALVKMTMSNTSMLPKPQWGDNKLKYHLPNEIPVSVARQGGLLYFRESMVKEGSFMSIPDLRDPISYKSFLPRSLTSKIPFSYAHIEGLKKLFGVVNESNMDKYIQDTLKTCEKSPTPGEKCACVTSAEDLIDFVVNKLGHRVHIWSTENVEGSYENVTIGAVKLIYGNLSEPPALCHSMPFIFQVYYCHVLQEVKLFAVDIHALKKVNQAIMACHYNTSTWNPNHIAFKLLDFGPGLIEVCHWMNENGMVWTKTIG